MALSRHEIFWPSNMREQTREDQQRRDYIEILSGMESDISKRKKPKNDKKEKDRDGA